VVLSEEEEGEEIGNHSFHNSREPKSRSSNHNPWLLILWSENRMVHLKQKLAFFLSFGSVELVHLRKTMVKNLHPTEEL